MSDGSRTVSVVVYEPLIVDGLRKLQRRLAATRPLPPPQRQDVARVMEVLLDRGVAVDLPADTPARDAGR